MKNDTQGRSSANYATPEQLARLARVMRAAAAVGGVELTDGDLGELATVAELPAAPSVSRAPAPASTRPAAPQLSRAGRRAVAAQERRQRHLDAVRAAGGEGYDPRDWAGYIWTGARAMHRSPARCAQLVAELPRALAVRLRRAALGVRRHDDGTWTRTRSWHSVRARTVAAVGWALWRHGLTTRRGGCARVCVGVSVGMIGALFVQLNGGHGYSRSWIAATHAGRDGRQRGALAELRDAGCFWSVQPPASVAPQYAGPKRRGKRHAFNQYCFDAALVADDAVGYSVADDDDVVRACRGALDAPARPQATAPPVEA